MSDVSVKNHADFIWSVADLLRGVYKQSEYGRVILPLTVLRRLDAAQLAFSMRSIASAARAESSGMRWP